MSGLIVDDGQEYIATKTLASNLYLGLMTTANVNSDNTGDTALQLGSGLTEISGTGYARKLLTGGSWSISGDTGSYAEQTFTVGAGGWNDVRGMFIAESLSGNDAIWAESFNTAQQGTKAVDSELKVTPSFQMRTQGES